MLINIIPNKLGKYIIYLGVTFLTASPFVGKSWRNILPHFLSRLQRERTQVRIIYCIS